MASFTMKRRNTDISKPRRHWKRPSKFVDGTYASALIYLKIVLIWSAILLTDFILEFRFEYLWPFWLLIQNCCDSYKYQGMVLSIFFLCCTLVSGAVCFFVLPVQPLFFIASTYIWVRYIWYSDRGICMPTIALLLMFMYTEASLRLKGLPKSPFHVNLCRPFAAHCAGFPFVTFGNAVGGYMQYRLRIWTQESVRMENEFYFELLENALPQQNQGFVSQDIHTLTLSSKCNVGETSGNSHSRKKMLHLREPPPSSETLSTTSVDNNMPSYKSELRKRKFASLISSLSSVSSKYSWGKTQLPTACADAEESDDQSNKTSSSRSSSVSSVGSIVSKNTVETQKIASEGPVEPTYEKKIVLSPVNTEIYGDNKFANEDNTKNNEDIRIEKLQSCLSELNLELNVKRQCESSEGLINDEKSTKNELAQLRRDNDQLQTKLHNLVSIKQKDKQEMKLLEKRLKAEIIAREDIEKILEEERRRRKTAEDITERTAAAVANNSRKEKEEERAKNLEGVEKECENLKRQLAGKEEMCRKLEKEVNDLKLKEKTARESDTLMSALAAMQEKNAMLEKSLSAETRLKLDLFSALGDANRQLEIAHSVRCQREVEIQDLKARIAEVLSVMPDPQISPATGHYLANFLESRRQPSVQLGQAQSYSTTIRSVPVTPLTHPTMDPHTIIHTNSVIQPSGVLGQMSLDPIAAAYAPPSTSL